MYYKTIPLKESTKYRLDKVKGNKSYDAIVEDMVTYFEVSGISPTSNIVSPVVMMKEQANRIIEVVRGVEKAQKKEFELILKQVEHAHFSQLTEDVQDAEAEKTLQNIISEMDKKERENQQLKAKLREQEDTHFPVSSISKDDLLRVRNLVKEFNNSSRFEITGLQKNRYSYDKIFIITSLGEIEEKLTSIINSL